MMALKVHKHSLQKRVYKRVSFFQRRLDSLLPRFERVSAELPKYLQRESEILLIKDNIKNLLTHPEVVVIFNGSYDLKVIAETSGSEPAQVLSTADGKPQFKTKPSQMIVFICYITIEGGRNHQQVLEDIVKHYFLQLSPVREEVQDLFFYVEFGEKVESEVLETSRGFIFSMVCARFPDWSGLERIIFKDDGPDRLQTSISNHMEHKMILAFDKTDCYLQSYLRQGLPIFGEESNVLSSLESELKVLIMCRPFLYDLYIIVSQQGTEYLAEEFVSQLLHITALKTKCVLVSVFAEKYFMSDDIIASLIQKHDFEDKLQSQVSENTKQKMRNLANDAERFSKRPKPQTNSADIETSLSENSGQTQHEFDQTQHESDQTRHESDQTQHESGQTRHESDQTRHKSDQTRHKSDETQHESDQTQSEHKLHHRCKQITTNLLNDITSVILDIEALVKKLQETLQLFERMRFEIKGCVRQTVTRKVEPERIIPVARNLRDEILSVPEVYGCGRIYGVFEIHVEKLDREVKKMLDRILNKHHFCHHYRVSKVVKKFENCAGAHEAGKKISPAVEAVYCCDRFGTLGGFVEDSTSKIKYAVSCAHVVCLKEVTDVYVLQEESDRYEALGTCYRHLTVPFGNRYKPLIDVAAVKVLDRVYPACNPFLRNDENERCKSKLVNDIPEQLVSKYPFVYKRGAATGLTFGDMCSSDYIMKVNRTLNSDYCILIASKVDTETMSFAGKGDSGSLVCSTAPQVDGVLAISMLSAGDMQLEGDRNPKYMSFTLSTAFDILKKQSAVDLNIPEECRL